MVPCTARHHIGHNRVLLPIMSMNRYRLLPIQVRVTLIIIQGALTLWRDVHSRPCTVLPSWERWWPPGAPQIAVERSLYLQCDWSHHLGVWSAGPSDPG